jgi:hypothetical protein
LLPRFRPYGLRRGNPSASRPGGLRGFNPSDYSLGLDSLYLVFKEQAPSGAIGEITASIRRRQGKFKQGPQFESV